MEPLALAGSLATIVGLLSNFKSERTGAELSDFMIWLQEQHQDQILSRIQSDDRLAQELKALLSRKHEELVLKLNALNEQLSKLAVGIDGFTSLARYLAPETPLSPQAQQIVKQLVRSGALFAIEISEMGLAKFILVGGQGNDLIEVTEQIFINEDIEALQSVGLLRIESTSQGARKLVPTRQAKEYVNAEDA